MKPFLPAAIFLIFTLFSCGHTNRPAKTPAQKAETPDALKPETSDVSLSSTRWNDLVEAIYQELVDKSPTLKALESQIKIVQESTNDSTSAFDIYNRKSDAYYLSAGNHLSAIKDSALRLQIEALINKSRAGYTGAISKYTALYGILHGKHESLNDLHAVLKITQTLPVIETFQRFSKIYFGKSVRVSGKTQPVRQKYSFCGCGLCVYSFVGRNLLFVFFGNRFAAGLE